MKKLIISPISLILLLMVVFTSCEEVIILDLKNSPPRTVIDATLNATSGEVSVQATKSLDFYHTGAFAPIENARVELADESGTVVALAEIGPGVYFAAGITVVPGELFKINIIVSSEEHYLAQTKAPVQVPLDSLKVARGFGDPRPTAPPVYLLKPKWRDPGGIANYYRFKVTTNSKPQSGSFSITNDEPFDGTEVDMPLYRYSFSLGDTVQLEFLNIDSVSYAYFNQINDMARPSFVSATPYNPAGNFDNGALGYFGIFWSERRNLIVSAGK